MKPKNTATTKVKFSKYEPRTFNRTERNMATE